MGKMIQLQLLATVLFFLQIAGANVSEGNRNGSRLVEKEITVRLAADNKRVQSGLEKPLRLSGYFKVIKQASSRFCLLSQRFLA